MLHFLNKKLQSVSIITVILGMALWVATPTIATAQDAKATAATISQDPQYILSFADSGAGGLIFAVDAYRDLLSYLISIESKYHVQFVFNHIGDTENAPYGQKSPSEIARLTKNFVGYMVNDSHSNVAVIACNTASTSVDDQMKEYFQTTYPDVPVMAIISKSAQTLYKRAKIVTGNTGEKEMHIGVLATPATVESGQYQKALEQIHADQNGKGVKLYTYFYGPKTWVYNIEHGASKEDNQKIISTDLANFLKTPGAEKISAMGLFCTHFPFFTKEIHGYLEEQKVKNVALVPQGRIFAGRIQAKITADLKAGKYKKRATPLDPKTIPHPTIYSNITGNNMDEIKAVLQKIAPDMANSVVFSNVTIKQI